MRTLSRAAIGVATIAASAVSAVPVFAATDSAPAAPAMGMRGGMHHGQGGQGMLKEGMRGMLFTGMAERFAAFDFAGAGVTKPAYWDQLVTWLKSDDAKKVAATFTPPARPSTPPTTPPVDRPKLDPLTNVDFTKAGVAKPAWWDEFVTFAKSDDAKKLHEHQRALHQGQRMQHMATRLGAVDFTAAKVAKPAFWDQLVTWLQTPDAKTLAQYLFATRAPKDPQAQGTPAQ